jgi:hypothetical protein
MVISEVRDAVKLLSELVDETRTILGALEDGRQYLQQHHENAAGDLADLLEQMRFTVAGAVSATRPVLDFDFTVAGSDVGLQPTRFNEYLLQVNRKIDSAEDSVHRLRGSCERIGDLQQALRQRAAAKPWWALLGDRAGQQALDLSEKMERLYQADHAMVAQISDVLDAGRGSLKAVRDELGKNGGPSVGNVSAAQAVMREQADAFTPVVNDLRQLRDRFAVQIRALDPAT